LFASDGKLVSQWTRWVTGALLAFMLWIGLAALSMSAKYGGTLAVQIGADIAFALACISGCFAAFAVALRFGAHPSRILSSASENAFGIYVLHYPFVVWLQYALLGTALFAIAKGALVFAVSLLSSWALAIAFRSIPFASALVGGERRAFSRRPAIPPRLVTPFDGDDRPGLTHIAR
jgi:surface polysaccharide O-acyltransferase-like enzyme